MSAVDLNEVAGARATHRFARLSASKARAVLNLIRDEDIDRAAEILQFCDRGAAEVISKVLNSAVANAENNEGLDTDELFVAECYADEGPTLKRWRPRARGRATRINKRTCHITVVVARMSDEELAIRELSESTAPTRTTPDRRARVAASRKAAGEDVEEEILEAEIEGEPDTTEEDSASESAESASSGGEDTATGSAESGGDNTAESGGDNTAEANSASESAESADSGGDNTAEQDSASESTGSASSGGDNTAPGPYGAHSALPLEDGSAPEGFDIKGNADSMKYHVPGSRYYKVTKAEVYFDSEQAAVEAGFTAPGGAKGDENEEA